MAKINKKSVPAPLFTHEGARASRTSLQNELERSVMSCLLWEDEFYESGENIAARISKLVAQNKPEFVADLAVKAREQMKLRHVPLLLVRELARNKEQRHVVADTLARIVQRPDELGEFLAIYWKDDKNQPLAAQIKKGLARAFTKFDEYQLAKWSKDADVTLRDVMFLTHPKPNDVTTSGRLVSALNKKGYARGAVRRHAKSVFTRLVKDEMKAAGTWEERLSAGEDKKQVFTELIRENKLGALAFLRNLRNMTESGVDRDTIIRGLQTMNVERVLPFRFITAAKYAPDLEAHLEKAMFKCLEGAEKLKGTTTLLIDVSGSMGAKVSAKSELSRLDAACGLAMLLREVGEDVRIYTFSEKTVEVRPRRGFALCDAIINSQSHGGTYLGSSLEHLKYGVNSDRLIVITDEQSADAVKAPKTKGYMLNVASYQNGVGYGKWNHIDGWSESIVKYIVAAESEN